MKLKLVVASMSVLGLISCPVFAATQTKHKKMKHHHVRHEAMAATATNVEDVNYKAMGALPIQCPKTDLYTMTMDRMDQNVGRAKPTVGCDNPIAFAGGINFDAKWGNRSIGYMGENNQRVALNDAYLNIFGNVNEWTTAFISATYSDFNDALVSSFNVNGQRPGIYSSAYPRNNLNVEQGFITIRNWNYYPVFLQLGKQFEDFGRYTIHPMTRTMDQVMSETLRTSANIGFITQMGVHGSAYVFDNPLRSRSASTGVITGHTPVNFGLGLGYDQMNEQLGWDVGAGYLYNMTGVNDVAYAVGIFNGGGTTGATANYTNRVAAGSLYADVNSGPFTLSGRYVSALQHFNNRDLSKYVTGSTQGAKPWSAGLTGGYGFNGWSKNQNVYLGYQASGDAVNLFLPQSRWLAGWGVEMWKNTNLGLEVNHDIDYNVAHGGTGQSSNAVNLRVGVTFG